MNRRHFILSTAALIPGARIAQAAQAAQIAGAVQGTKQYHFHLHGGLFYGPGPIKPDTPLPDGDVEGISFDTTAWRGHAPFQAASTMLSDGKTRMNANINAGRLSLGEDKSAKSFLLSAVDGGPNGGTEQYAFNDKGDFVWRVDLALDPGFPEGIIRVDNFELTTGWVEIPRSLQAMQNIPGGYDKAGSLASGAYLAGRVGDFDQDGFLDGVLVAAANVPMQADMLPGAPVGNQRPFTSNIPVDPVKAADFTMTSVLALKPLIARLLDKPDIAELKVILADINGRIDAASLNCEDAFLRGDTARKYALREVRWRIDAAKKLFFVPWAFLTSYPDPAGKPSESMRDSTRRGFEVVAEIEPRLKDISTTVVGAKQ